MEKLIVKVNENTTVEEIVNNFKKTEIIEMLASYDVYVANAMKVKKEVLAKELIFTIEVENEIENDELDSLEERITESEDVLTAEDSGLAIDHVTLTKEEETPVVVTTAMKLAISKRVKAACMNNKLSVMGISTQDLKDIICHEVFSCSYLKWETIQNLVGCDTYGNPLYQSFTKRVGINDAISEAMNVVISDTVSRMVSQDCLKENKKGTFYYLTSKLLHWNFVA